MFTGWRPREFFSLCSCSNKDPVGGKMLLCNQMFTCLLVIIFLTKCKLMCKFIIILCNIYHKDRETWTLFNISSFGTLFSAFFVITLFTCRLIGPTGARKPQSGILRIKCLVQLTTIFVNLTIHHKKKMATTIAHEPNLAHWAYVTIIHRSGGDQWWIYTEL